MNIPFEELFQYVFDQLPEEKMIIIESAIKKDTSQSVIINGLLELKEKFEGDPEKVKSYLANKKSKVSNRLFPSKGPTNKTYIL